MEEKVLILTLDIDKFRRFKDQHIKFGKRLNLICGLNGTGKSSLLAMIGHSAEIKMKEGKTLDGKQFRTEFGEIFKLSEQFDFTEDREKKFRYSTTHRIGEYEETRKFTVNKQKDKNEKIRIRPIPRGKTHDGRSTSAKIRFPVFYLGLSRLYPIGEIPEDVEIKNKPIALTDEEKSWIINRSQEILGTIDDSVNSVQEYKTITKGSKISGIGINTDKYDFSANSVGQDNTLQILIALLSFIRLSKTMSDYQGGILIIDEIEASLFPHAQASILKLLDGITKNINLQVIFTSHSPVVIDYMWRKYSTERRSIPTLANYNIIFLNYHNSQVVAKNEFDLNDITAKLNFTLRSKEESINPQMVIYTEDSSASWFLKKIIISLAKVTTLEKGFCKLIELIRPMNLANNQLIPLIDGDEYFKTRVVIIVDGDTDIPEDKKEFNNLLALPGEYKEANKDFSPEESIIKFLTDNEKPLEFFSSMLCENRNFNKDVLRNSINETKESLKLDRKPVESKNIAKRWFFNNKLLLEETEFMDYWILSNKDKSWTFAKKLIIAYNTIAKNTDQDFLTLKFSFSEQSTGIGRLS